MSKNNKKYWLMKSESASYSIDNLKSDDTTSWGGVRNYQARNYMMRDMSIGDIVFFYHSGGTVTTPAGIYGLASVCSPTHPDQTQFDKKDDHYDPKASKEKPFWYCVDIDFVKKFKTPLTLSQIKFDPKLQGMVLTQTGSRLSVQPVSVKHGEYLLKKLL